MGVSIFDRLVSKETGEKERKPIHPTPYRRMFSELDMTGGELKEGYPEESKTVDAFIRVLKEASRARYKEAINGELRPMKAEARFFLSEDRMSAYACLFPPENGGEKLTLEEFLGDMRYEGIQYGILQEKIEREFGLGYFRIFPVARGKAPLAGEDGKVTELLQRRKNMCLEIQNGSQVDFEEDAQLQPIRKGTVICLIRPPKPGMDGMDVTGNPLPCPEAIAAYVPQGKNTVIGRGGQALTADADGILYIEDDRFCIHEQKIIDGDLNHFQGTLQISGSLYIGGNVDGGVVIEATGEVVINGKMGQARITSTGGTIRVQKGVYGTEGKTFLTAAYQAQAPVMEHAEIDAGTSVIAETISDSVIRCGGTVYVMNGRGMIVNSLIQAEDSILCLRAGNLAGGRSRFSVGYPLDIPESWDRMKAELTATQSTLDMLWKSITRLRKKGLHMSDSEKSLLEQLVEQRDLYVEKRETLAAELRVVNKVLEKKSKGRVRCEKIYPFLDVQIGKFTIEIMEVEENCNIRVEGNRMLLK